MYPLSGPSQIINGEGMETLTVTRDGAPTYTDGKPVYPTPTTFDVVCNVQPVSGRDLLLVPEGDRFKEQYYIWSEQNEMPVEVNDRITREGVNFQVQSPEMWGSYKRVRIMRMDTGPERTP